MRLPDTFLARPVAHRGLHDLKNGIAENSRDAFEAAILHGFGIECDLQLSADQQPMVFHDYDLQRLTGQKGPIQGRDARDLKSMTLTGAANRIETLSSILDLVAGRVPLLIELKDQDGGMGPNIGALEVETAKALDGYNGDAAVMSFNPHSVARMKTLTPNRACGIVTSRYDPKIWPLSSQTCDRLRDIPDFETSGASFISHEASDLSRARVAQLKAAGADILCWTIRSEAEAEQALKIAQNITFEGYLPA